MRLEQTCFEEGIKKFTAKQVSEIVCVPVRTLYEWKRKPIPESTRLNNVGIRADQKLND